MAKKRNRTSAKKTTAPKVAKERKGNAALVKRQLRRLPSWPNLRVRDWKQIVVDHYRPRHGLTSTSALYVQFKKFVANAKNYSLTKASKEQPVEQEVVMGESQLGMVEAELEEEQVDN